MDGRLEGGGERWGFEGLEGVIEQEKFEKGGGGGEGGGWWFKHGNTVWVCVERRDSGDGGGGGVGDKEGRGK